MQLHAIRMGYYSFYFLGSTFKLLSVLSDRTFVMTFFSSDNTILPSYDCRTHYFQKIILFPGPTSIIGTYFLGPIHVSVRTCFLLFMIKLLYVDDVYSIAPHDMPSSTIALVFASNCHPHAKKIVCGKFSGVVFSIAFIKKMHIRRVPNNSKYERMFSIA